MTAKGNKAGAIYLAGIGLAIALVGAVFVYLLWGSFMKAKATREWTETSCLIIQSKVKERSEEHISKEYQWGVEYNYDFEGKPYSSKLYTLRGSKWTSRRDEVKALMEEFPKDGKAICFVNPADPSRAILKHDSKAGGYSIWFPMLFVIGGLGIAFSALRKSGIKLIPC